MSSDMKYFGIKTPEKQNKESYIYWISTSKNGAWELFFEHPNKHGDKKYWKAPAFDAIRAYEAIGYKCVELDVKIKE